MSAQDFRVGDPIDSQVARKIQSLQRVFGDTSDGDARRNYIELQSATPWIRMQSGVKLSASLAKKYRAKEGYDLAKKYVLFGVNSRIDERLDLGSGLGKKDLFIGYNTNQGDPTGYDYDSTYGFGHRPKPGILDMSIHSHNRFGSLRTAVVRFQCWTRDQIDALEILYMRPGYSVLLEWGHSKILTTDGLNVVDMDLGINLYESGLDTAVEIRNRIVANKNSLHYGYDAILGVVKNFSWQVRPDGGYDCTTHLVTTGEMIESYKANFYLKQSVITDDLLENYKETIQDSPTGEIIWPALHKDAKAEFPDLGALEGKIDQWVSQAEAAVSQAADAIGTFAASASGEVIRDRLKAVLGTATIKNKITADNAKDVIDKFVVILKLLKVVGGGQTLYKQTKQFKYSSDSPDYLLPENTYTDYTIAVQNKWKWLVDFNETGNNFGAGQTPDFTFPGGARAAWMFTDIVNSAKLCSELLTTLEIDYKFSKNPTVHPVFTVLTEAFNLLKAVKLKDKAYIFDGSGQGTQAFFYGGNNNNNPKQTGLYIDTNEKSYETFLAGLVKNLPDFSRTTGKSIKIANQGDNSTFGYNILGSDNVNSSTIVDLYDNASKKDGKYPNAKVGDPWLSIAPNDAKSPLAKDTTIKQIDVYYVLPPGVARFPVMKWTGFDPEKAAAGTVVEGQDEDTGETFKYYDPNDDYTSKLHYYLRTKLETPYTKAYLSIDTSGKDFTAIFKYRDTLPGTVDELFDTTSAPTTRNTVPEDVKEGLKFLLGGRFFSDQELEIRNHIYIKLGTLLELINRHTLRSNSEYFFTFQSSYGKTKYPKYFTFDDHISIDPRICILPHTLETLGIGNSQGRDLSPKILNIELSINYILDTLNRYITADGKVAVYDYVQEILDGIVKATGGVNDYQLQYMEDDAVYHIVDRRVIAPNKPGDFGESRINIYGLNSIIKDINLVSKLTPKISSMIAISAQDSPYTSMDEATGFNAINRGMTDRIYTKRYDVESKGRREEIEDGKLKAYNEFRDQLKTDIIGLITHLGYFYRLSTVPRNSADTQYGIYENYCKFLLGGKVMFEEGGRATYNFVIPFELQFKMYGVSGLKVMDAFLIDQTILPRTYGGDQENLVGFLITGVEHTVNRNEWSTNIKSQIFNIGDDNQTGKQFTDLQTDIVTAVANIDLGSSSGGGGNSQDPGPGKSDSSIPKKVDLTASWEEIAKTYLVIKESFTREATKDVNAYRLGYGTDSILINSTKPASKENIRTVKIGDTTTQADAIKVLEYEIPIRFKPRVVGNGSKKITEAQWNSLSNPAKAALIIYAYNVGSLTTYKDATYNIAQSIKDGNLQAAAIAIQNGPVTGGGVYYPGLRTRRDQEAKIFLS